MCLILLVWHHRSRHAAESAAPSLIELSTNCNLTQRLQNQALAICRHVKLLQPDVL